MGKRKNIYFKDDDIVLKLEQEENIAELISDLLREHYNQSLEFLQQQKENLATEQKVVQLKIESILKLRNANKKIKEEEENKLKEIESENNILDRIKELQVSGKITLDQYFNLFKNGKLNLKMASKLI